MASIDISVVIRFTTPDDSPITPDEIETAVYEYAAEAIDGTTLDVFSEDGGDEAEATMEVLTFLPAPEAAS